MWGNLSDGKTDLSLTIAAGPHQSSHSQAQVPRVSWPHFTVSDSKIPQPGGPGLHIYIPQEQGGQVIPPGTGFRFIRLLRLAGRRWRYANPPPHGEPTIKLIVLVTEPWHGPNKNFFPHYCVFSRCRGNVSTELLPSSGCSTVTCLHSSFLAMGLHVIICTAYFNIACSCSSCDSHNKQRQLFCLRIRHVLSAR
jgi:hypothetical protein